MLQLSQILASSLSWPQVEELKVFWIINSPANQRLIPQGHFYSLTQQQKGQHHKITDRWNVLAKEEAEICYSSPLAAPKWQEINYASSLKLASFPSASKAENLDGFLPCKFSCFCGNDMPLNSIVYWNWSQALATKPSFLHEAIFSHTSKTECS